MLPSGPHTTDALRKWSGPASSTIPPTTVVCNRLARSAMAACCGLPARGVSRSMTSSGHTTRSTGREAGGPGRGGGDEVAGRGVAPEHGVGVGEHGAQAAGAAALHHGDSQRLAGVAAVVEM